MPPITYITCSHMEGRDANTDPDGYQFYLGDGNMLSVCELCASKMQIELVTSFMRLCGPAPKELSYLLPKRVITTACEY